MSEELDALAEETKAVIVSEVKRLLEGLDEDLATYGEKLNRQLVAAIASQNEDNLRVVQHSVRLLAEVHRIRGVDASWQVLEKVLGLAMVFGLAFLRAGIGGALK